MRSMLCRYYTRRLQHVNLPVIYRNTRIPKVGKFLTMRKGYKKELDYVAVGAMPSYSFSDDSESRYSNQDGKTHTNCNEDYQPSARRKLRRPKGITTAFLNTSSGPLGQLGGQPVNEARTLQLPSAPSSVGGDDALNRRHHRCA